MACTEQDTLFASMDMNEFPMMKSNDAQKRDLLEFYRLRCAVAVQYTLSVSQIGSNKWCNFIYNHIKNKSSPINFTLSIHL